MTQNPANHQIVCRGNVVGMVQGFSMSENKTVTPIFSLGVEGPVTTAVGNYGGGTLNTPLVAIYDITPLEAFGITDSGGGVGGLRALPRLISLSQQREPVDIRSVIYTPAEGQEEIETYRNCWVTSYGKSVNVTGAMVSVNCAWRFEKIVA